MSSFFPIKDQISLVSGDLHASLITQFATGIYIGVYLSTAYLYLSHNKSTLSRKCALVSVLTVLFAISMLGTGVNWWCTKLRFDTLLDTRLSIAEGSLEGIGIPRGISISNDVSTELGYLLADGVMIWRCFNVCGRSLRRSLVPLLLFVAEIVLVIVAVIFETLYDYDLAFRNSHPPALMDFLTGSVNLIVAVTTLASTLFICYHIYTRTDRKSRRRYSHIIDAVIQSSALSAISFILTATTTFMAVKAQTLESLISGIVFYNYAGRVSSIMTGLAPTLMVARLTIFSETSDSGTSSVNLPSNDELVEPGEQDFGFRNGEPNAGDGADIEEIERERSNGSRGHDYV
ncbi:hypothetical protein D9613_008479 [Agrocybe pediades]|uniref:Uncharacterized protein n=1 Tax=Agrocybe pediades TaxID=84607 RepID=A0A8H4QU52_9AGAR|nr:hypothetical protein D9613_008479 [Agrocybe pediades]